MVFFRLLFYINFIRENLHKFAIDIGLSKLHYILIKFFFYFIYLFFIFCSFRLKIKFVCLFAWNCIIIAVIVFRICCELHSLQRQQIIGNLKHVSLCAIGLNRGSPSTQTHRHLTPSSKLWLSLRAAAGYNWITFVFA